MHFPQLDYDKQLDRRLKQQYHDLCFNPARRHALLRLTTHPKSPPLSQPTASVGELQDLTLLHSYIAHVYRKYGIEDPINKERRLADRHTGKATPEKSLNVTGVSQGDRLTRTKKKLLNMKDSFKQDSQHVVSTTDLPAHHPHQQTSRANRGIGYRTKEKIRFKTVTNELQDYPILREFTLSSNRADRSADSAVEETANPPAKPSNREGVEALQLCPMCLDLVGEGEAGVLERECAEWAAGGETAVGEGKLAVAAEMRRLEREIYQSLFGKQQAEVGAQLAELKESIKLWVDRSERGSFSTVQQKFECFSVGLFRKVARLNYLRGVARQEGGQHSGSGV